MRCPRKWVNFSADTNVQTQLVFDRADHEAAIAQREAVAAERMRVEVERWQSLTLDDLKAERDRLFNDRVSEPLSVAFQSRDDFKAGKLESFRHEYRRREEEFKREYRPLDELIERKTEEERDELRRRELRAQAERLEEYRRRDLRAQALKLVDELPQHRQGQAQLDVIADTEVAQMQRRIAALQTEIRERREATERRINFRSRLGMGLLVVAAFALLLLMIWADMPN
jgi:hypothetical protein